MTGTKPRARALPFLALPPKNAAGGEAKAHRGGLFRPKPQRTALFRRSIEAPAAD